jgi:hypothetical protein
MDKSYVWVRGVTHWDNDPKAGGCQICRAERAEAKINALRLALAKFGGHRWNCILNSWNRPHEFPPPCDCGFDTVLETK